MPFHNRATVAVTAFAFLAGAGVFVARAHAAATPTQKCTIAKLKAAGKELRAEMVCYEKAKKAAAGVDADCLMDAQSRADTIVAKAGVACPGTTADIGATVGNCLGAFVADDPDNGDCPAASAKIIGTGAKGVLGCQAKEVTKPGTFSACDGRADLNLGLGIVKVGLCTIVRGKFGDEQAEVDTDIDDCDRTLDSIIEKGCGSFLTTWGSLGSGDGQFKGPSGVAVDANGHVFVADENNDRIQRFDDNGVFQTAWGSLGSADGAFTNPTGVAVDANGNVFVADMGNDRIQKFDGGGTFLTKWGSTGGADGQFASPQSVAADGSGHVFVADTSNHRVQKFDNAGGFLLAWGSFGGGDGQFFGPASVAVDPSGKVLVADATGRIQKFDNTGTFLTKWAAGSGAPAGLAVDGTGNVFFTVPGSTNHVEKFDNAGTFLTAWGIPGSAPGEFARPGGVAADGSGNVFVADSDNNRIEKFSCP
jgi:streptogramin lyase